MNPEKNELWQASCPISFRDQTSRSGPSIFYKEDHKIKLYLLDQSPFRFGP